jgi:hypothetical protein
MLNSLTFWTMVAGLLAFVAKFFLPSFPLGNAEVLSLILFLLGLFGVVPEARLMAARMGVSVADLLKSKAFWEMVAGLVAFVILFYFPTFPLDANGILGILLFILALFGITPELKLRAELRALKARG